MFGKHDGSNDDSACLSCVSLTGGFEKTSRIDLGGVIRDLETKG